MHGGNHPKSLERGNRGGRRRERGLWADRQPALEAPAVVAGLDDVAVVGQAIEERGGDLRIAEHAWPFAKGEVGGDNDPGALVELADEVEEELAAGPGKGR